MSDKRIKLSALIEAGIIKPNFPIYVNFRGKDFRAEIDSDGFVLMNGKRHTSLSIAGGVVRATVSGKPDDGLPYRRVNGWTFWRYIDEDGQTKPLDNLRKKYKAGAPLMLENKKDDA
nr:hypothetical protein [uncultured Halomonas sp.]